MWQILHVESTVRTFVNIRHLIHKHVKINVDQYILESTHSQEHVQFSDGQMVLASLHSVWLFSNQILFKLI